MPEFGINDLPDETRLEEDSKYLLSGKSLRALITVCRKMWRGDNVTVPLQGGSIRKSEQGDTGYNLFVPTVQPGSGGSDPGWSWKAYNATTASTGGGVVINGGDGFTPSVNGYVGTIDGDNADEKIGDPAAYPIRAVTGNGWVYVRIDTSSTINPVEVDSAEILFDTDLPAPDDETPNTYMIIPIAHITGYTEVEGMISFSVGNTTSYGFSSVHFCGNALEING